MEDYQKRLALTLAETGALFFHDNLFLKDGRPTPYFVNMAMFRTGRLALAMGSFFAGMMVSRNLLKEVDIILGPSYKGSAIAMATSIALWKDHQCDLLFDYDRKEAKTHGEASSSKSMFVNGTLFEGCRIFVLDDVVSSMRTKYDLLEKIGDEAGRRHMTFQVVGIGIGVDREQTTAFYDQDGKVIPGRKGGNAIRDFVSGSGIPVHSVASISKVIAYLYKEQVPVMIQGAYSPLDDKTKTRFEEYQRMYGADQLVSQQVVSAQ